MVLLVNHGGNCCGARHLYSFDGTTNDHPDTIDQALQQVTNGRMVEVILNERQVQRHPAVLQRLADLGFVLDGRWINDNHGTNCYSFRRAGMRRSLENLPFHWEGMVFSTGLGGDLPHIPAPGVNPNQGGRRERENRLLIGDRIRIDNPRSRYNQQMGLIVRFSYPYDRHPVAHLDTGAETSVMNCIRLDAPNPPPVPARPAPQRHPQAGDGAVRMPNNPQQPVVEPPAERVVFSSFHNRYQDGRVGAGYENAEAARLAAPRCQRRVRKDVYNTGRIEIVDL